MKIKERTEKGGFNHPSVRAANPKVTIIVLNYIHWESTVACVRSLLLSTYQNYEIILIDNASPNDSEVQLRKLFPGLVFFQTGNNLGYTGGINYGIKRVLEGDSEYILVINPDTTVEKDLLVHLVASMIKNPTAAIAGGTIYYSDDTNRIWYAGGKLVPWKGYAEHFTTLVNNADASTDRQVTFVTGCLMLLRVSALRNIGLLDDRFFMYLDDIEYSSRVRRFGYELLYVPEAKIFHKIIGHDEAVYKLYYSVRNRFLLIKTAFSGLSRWVAVLYFSLSLMVKMMIWWFNNAELFQASRMGIEDYFRGRFGPGRGLGYLAKLKTEDKFKAQ
jgi:GT2 family glycosyltransferase